VVRGRGKSNGLEELKECRFVPAFWRLEDELRIRQQYQEAADGLGRKKRRKGI
jgi:hypothetical protein